MNIYIAPLHESYSEGSNLLEVGQIPVHAQSPCYLTYLHAYRQPVTNATVHRIVTRARRSVESE